MSPVVEVASIPTLTELYADSRLPLSEELPEDFGPPSTPSAVLNSRISLVRQNITKLAATSIVNAANSSLLGGGGVDGAIHAAAGPDLYEECRELDGCETGSAKITGGHELPSQHVIHAVGPIYSKEKRLGQDKPAKLLRGCYRASLDLAAEVGGSIAFSCLSTGVYGYPNDEAAKVAIKEVHRWLEEQEKSRRGPEEAGNQEKDVSDAKQQGQEHKKPGVDRVIFCCFLERDEAAYQMILPHFFPPVPPLSEQRQTSAEPPTKKVKSSAHEGVPAAATSTSQDLDEKEWESVEQPSMASSTTIDGSGSAPGASVSASTELAEEGVKVEAANLAEDEGVKVEKPTEKESGTAKNMLAKDW